MPSYDYRCQDCQGEFTVERSMSDCSKQLCVGCKSENINRIWSVFMVAAGGSTADYGQGTARLTSAETSGSTTRKSGCGSCVSRSCGTCH